MSSQGRRVMAVDPGRSKLGLAVVEMSAESDRPSVLHREVVDAGQAERVIARLASTYSPDVILIGGGTASRPVVALAERLGAAPVRVVDERLTTLRARARYFRENPPRGLRRLIPVSLQTPGRPYDDYAAVVLAESYLCREAADAENFDAKNE